MAKPRKRGSSTPPLLTERVKWLLPVVVSVVIAAAVYLVAVSLHPRPPVQGDALGYTMTAQRLVDSRMFSFGVKAPSVTDKPNAAVTPGYIMFLAGIYGAAPGRSADATASTLAVQPAVQDVQFTLSLLTVALIAGCASVLGGRRLTYLAGILAALYLPFAWSTTVALSECLAATLVAAQLLLALLLARPRPQHATALLVGLGAVSAALALVRPVTALWIVVPFVYLALRKFYSWKELARMSVLALAGFLVLMAPWWVRNAASLHRIVLLSEGASNPTFLSTGGYPLTAEEQLVSKTAVEQGRNPEGAVALYRMKRQLRTQPIQLFGPRITIAGAMVTTPWMASYEAFGSQYHEPTQSRIAFGPLPPVPSSGLVWAGRFTNVYQFVLVIAALVGVMFVRRVPLVALVASVPVYFVVVHFFTLFINRYFFPAMPAVVLLAAIGIFGVTRTASMWLRSSPRFGWSRRDDAS